MRRLAGRTLLLALGLGLAVPTFDGRPARAQAADLPARSVAVPSRCCGGGNGNGRHNYNAFTIRSPAHIHGVQIVSNGNAGGSGNVINAYCRKRRHCRIAQRQITRFP